MTNSKVSDRIEAMGYAMRNGDLSTHAAVKKVAHDDRKIPQSWGPAMRV